MMKTLVPAVAGVLITVVSQLPGQTREPQGEERPAIQAVRLTLPIHLDGRLDEPVWQQAPAATQFTQRNPTEGARVSERTEVRIAYDEQAIYVGARLFDSSGTVSSRMGRRDSSLPGSDWFSVSFDSYHDHLTAFKFSVNPAGVRRDEQTAANGNNSSSWDPVWAAQAHVDELGWTAEMRIPLSQLRYRPAEAQTWGIQMIRQINRTAEEAWFAFTPKRERSGVARFGHLTGLAGLISAERLELLPYVLTRGQYERVSVNQSVPFTNPYSDGSDHTSSLGLDLKYRIASNLTLDASFNPDFGQVEADPATINLTAFETRFDERRPFFVAGSDVFGFGSGDAQLFYTRRIGAAPPGRLPSDQVYAHMPDHATILGAAKVSGKVRGWSLGVLDAVTAREHADYITADRVTGTSEVAPLTNFFATRARRELRQGFTTIGGMVTAANRDLRDDLLADRVRSSAYAGGVDFVHQWAERAWALSGFVSGAHIAGRAPVITAAQRSSARYYHRPDADHLFVDSAATSLSGWAGRLDLSKEAGEHWNGEVSLSTISPGFETNDLGFQSRADERRAFTSLSYTQQEPGKVFREWSAELQPSARWNWGGDRTGTALGLELNTEFLNYWRVDFEFDHSFAALDDRLTRGGPLTRRPRNTSYAVSVESDDRKRWTIEASVDAGSGPAGSSISTDLTFGFRPADNWNITVSPGWTRDRSTAQYLEAVADPLAATTYGHRYVFADLEEQELGVSLRANVTFTPALTLEVYARPFFGTGRFDNPKELRAPRTFQFARYEDIGTVESDDHEWVIDPDGAGPADEFELDDEDFTFRSLRGNAVLRWEWRPGSTLFLVWQQQRESEVALGDLRLGREFRRLAATPPRNVFMFKVSYWLNR
jgi:Domain of unknown function (DUF5916)/Carbohydrate family 9 binding domain-like